MITKIAHRVFFILLLVFHSMSSQEAQNDNGKTSFFGYIYSKNYKIPAEKATVKIYLANGHKTFIADENGKFEMPNEYVNNIDYVEVSSIGFEKKVSKIVSDTIFLDDYSNQLSEVIVNSKSKIKDELSFFEKLKSFETNFSWNAKAAVYIPKSNDNKYVKNLLFAVSDFGGVKNLKYLPFKVNLYTVDSLGFPYKPILEKDILVTKTDTEKWTTVDVSKFKVAIPDEGFFVVFIILDGKDYKTDFVWSKHGSIAAVPALKAYKYNKNYIRKSYLCRPYNYALLNKSDAWTLEKLHYMIDIE
ncbi:hypothetical protein FLJC2902T_01630 [Flavobacterium limnosediminis JC2902]|uniref:Carboxypeptidase-like regulatory domain-containing protein n=1 Tax=Flavobacterium limnosediminis JC2902 TaxID=1341181 RepID=V6SZ68_9FLAO|nr:hypothetical protein [Flavobacterium limnosediminis]ESU29690.1 hypothetical protein FLJC2902T_01630 [Flavobacterium limnosediminis JC2902]